MTERSTTDRRATILEVAELAGVSHQTVSRYLRFKGEGLKPATRERVEYAITELNYRPNLVARSMRTRVTGRVAVVLPALAFNPARMLAGATTKAHDSGFTVEVLSPEGGAELRAERILELADSRQVDGILSFAPVKLRGEQSASDTPIVISAEFDDEMRGTGELADAEPIREFVERLASLGHRRFYHVAGDARFPSAVARVEAYEQTVARLGLESVGVYAGDWSGDSGIAAVRALAADQRPTAIIAANDLVAVGVIRGARERGWDIPGEISVTGWDNDPIAAFLTPTLTTVSMNLERLGSNAMARLIGVLRKEAPELSTDPISKVHWRESTTEAPS